MALARTKEGAQERVRMKRYIRKNGGKIDSDATTKEIRAKYAAARKKNNEYGKRK